MCISKATRDAYFNPEVKFSKYSMAMTPCYGVMWIVWIILAMVGFFVGLCADVFVWIGWLVSCGCCFRCCPGKNERKWGYCKAVDCDPSLPKDVVRV